MLREARQTRTPPCTQPHSDEPVGRWVFWLHNMPSARETSCVCPCPAWKPSRFIYCLELMMYLHDAQDICPNLASKHSWRTTLGYLRGFRAASRPGLRGA